MANPTRLVELEKSDPTHVVESASFVRKELVPYITLSHRSRRNNMPKLTRSTLDDRRKELPVQDFPRVFKDAFTVCRKLDVRYIWIDALCIIQDDVSDWETESTSIRQVYQNAFCNIGAYAAAQGSSGLFVDRDPRQV